MLMSVRDLILLIYLCKSGAFKLSVCSALRYYRYLVSGRTLEHW